MKALVCMVEWGYILRFSLIEKLSEVWSHNKLIVFSQSWNLYTTYHQFHKIKNDLRECFMKDFSTACVHTRSWGLLNTHFREQISIPHLISSLLEEITSQETIPLLHSYLAFSYISCTLFCVTSSLEWPWYSIQHCQGSLRNIQLFSPIQQVIQKEFGFYTHQPEAQLTAGLPWIMFGYFENILKNVGAQAMNLPPALYHPTSA